MSQVELARRSKISTTTVNEIEKKSFRDIRLSTIVSLAQNLEIPVVALLLESDLDMVQPSDQAQLLKASETIFRITRKISNKDQKDATDS